MAPTKEELLFFLQQAHIDYPHLTKEELAVLALGHFAENASNQADQMPATEPIKEEPSAEIFFEPLRRFKEQLLLLPPGKGDLLDAVPVTELPVDNTEMPRTAMNRSVVEVILATVLFLAILAGAYLFVNFQPAKPSQEDLSSLVVTLRKTSPDETGELAQFGKRFAGNASFYNDKYQNKILEMLGVVELVERKPDGCLEATLLLADSRNKVFRARFRFLPEQEEAIALARGTMAVIKGKYMSYSDGVLMLFPSVIVYNSAQPD